MLWGKLAKFAISKRANFKLTLQDLEPIENFENRLKEVFKI